MLAESIAFIIFVCSAGGVALILIKKAPVLSSLPPNGKTGIREHRFVSKIESRIREFFVFPRKQMFLHKLLSWVKCLTIKTEVKIDALLHGIRRRAQKIDKELKIKK